MFEKIKEKIANSKVYIAKNNYKYFIYPLEIKIEGIYVIVNKSKYFR